MMLLRNVNQEVPSGVGLSPHRNALIVNPAIFVQLAIYRWLNPPRLTCSRLVCQPRRSRQHIACMHALDKAARAHILQGVLGREVVSKTWNLLSPKRSRLPYNKFRQPATSLVSQAISCGMLWVPV